MGSPSQQLTLQLDTGSCNLWVPSEDCPTVSEVTQVGCRLPSYAYPTSTTFENLGNNTILSYGKGLLNGTFAADDVALGDLVANNMTFILADQAYSQQTAGIVGFAGNAQCKPGLSSFFQTLESQGVLDDNMFSLWMGPDAKGDIGGELILGGYDPAHYNGSLTWVPTSAAEAANASATGGYWAINITSVTLSTGEVLESISSCAAGQCTALVDSGTTMLVGPNAAVQTIYGLLNATVIPGSYSASEVTACQAFINSAVGQGLYNLALQNGFSVPATAANRACASYNGTSSACQSIIANIDGVAAVMQVANSSTDDAFALLYEQCNDLQASYEIPCPDNPSSLPDIIFNIGGTDFVVGPEHYLYELSGGMCQVLIGTMGTIPNGLAWILGDVYMQNMYVAFNYGNSSVGLAPSINTIESAATGDVTYTTANGTTVTVPAGGVQAPWGGWTTVAMMAMATLVLGWM